MYLIDMAESFGFEKLSLIADASAFPMAHINQKKSSKYFQSNGFPTMIQPP